MKILLDTCVSGGGSEILEAAGHDVVWAGAWDIDPGDDEILNRAYREGRVLVTLAATQFYAEKQPGLDQRFLDF